jgi:hypothetical protein
MIEKISEIIDSCKNATQLHTCIDWITDLYRREQIKSEDVVFLHKYVDNRLKRMANARHSVNTDRPYLTACEEF